MFSCRVLKGYWRATMGNALDTDLDLIYAARLRLQGVKGGKVVKKTRKERKKQALQLKRAAEAAAEQKRGLKYQKAISRYQARTQELMRKVLACDMPSLQLTRWHVLSIGTRYEASSPST